MKEIKRFFALRRLEFFIWLTKVLDKIFKWSMNKSKEYLDAGKKLL